MYQVSIAALRDMVVSIAALRNVITFNKSTAPILLNDSVLLLSAIDKVHLLAEIFFE